MTVVLIVRPFLIGIYCRISREIFGVERRSSENPKDYSIHPYFRKDFAPLSASLPRKKNSSAYCSRLSGAADWTMSWKVCHTPRSISGIFAKISINWKFTNFRSLSDRNLTFHPERMGRWREFSKWCSEIVCFFVSVIHISLNRQYFRSVRLETRNHLLKRIEGTRIVFCKNHCHTPRLCY